MPLIKNNLDYPVFIGGTGRCGTTVMANYLASDSNFHLPCRENKLFVEQDGFIDLMDIFTNHNCPIRKHIAISRFIEWAKRLAIIGCETVQLNPYLNILSESIGYHKAAEKLQRDLPDQNVHIHGIGHRFKKGHYEKCINNFINKIIHKVNKDGTFNTAGMMKPFYLAKDLKRSQILEYIRNFAYELYGEDENIRWIDDTPSNSKQLPSLIEIFPNAKFIHMVRNPFDVADSMIEKVWSPYNTILDALKGIQIHHKHLYNLSSTLEKDNLITIKLEDLVMDPLLIQEKLSVFLGSQLNLNQSIISQKKAHINRHNHCIKDEEIKELSFLNEWMNKMGYNL
tara:strand:+ start:1065 stop:2084 length:1020 start_codon:yes stop_codon:yes gene_type:complete